VAAATPEEEVAVSEALHSVIGEGTRVSIEYVLTTDDGTIVDNNDGDLLVYDHGDSPLLPAVEEALLGLSRGDAKRVTLEAEDAFGPVDPELVKAVPSAGIPEASRTVGSEFSWRFPEGTSYIVRVKEVKGDELVVDFNHPLAGKRLHFDIEIVAVRPIPAN
jgi:FKBP-type peptidyl-prolyl cis-trans isomerase SlyD